MDNSLGYLFNSFQASCINIFSQFLFISVKESYKNLIAHNSIQIGSVAYGDAHIVMHLSQAAYQIHYTARIV